MGLETRCSGWFKGRGVFLSLGAFRAGAVEDDFGVADGVAGADTEGADEVGGDFGFLEAFDAAAGFADEVGMAVGGVFAGVAEGVAPDAVFAADAMDDGFFGVGVKGAVDGDGIGGGEAGMGHPAEAVGAAEGGAEAVFWTCIGW